MSDPFDFIPENWSDVERQLWEPFGDAVDDSMAQTPFNEGYFNPDLTTDERVAIREALDDYLQDVYGYDFSEIFDWEAWREAYGEAF